MTVHMVRLFIEPPKNDAQTAIDNWVAKHTTWSGDPDTHGISKSNTEIDGTGTEYIIANYRFEQKEGAADLLDDLETELDSLEVNLWYRVVYHACQHDEDGSRACSWEEVRENGTVPNDIPTFM